MEDGYSEQGYNKIVEKVEGTIRNDRRFATMVEERIQYNIDHYVYFKLCKYFRPAQHEHRSNNVQLETDMAHARSWSRRARRTNQFIRAMDAAVIHREEDAAALVIRARV